MLADAAPRALWHDLHDARPTSTPPAGPDSADLVIIGGGFTGLWSAVMAKRRHPERDVMLLESEHIGFGATGRNGGFISDSLTHGLSHGLALWPGQIDELLARGRENLADLATDLAEAGIEADLRLVGKTIVATRPHEVSGLAGLSALLRDHGEDATLLTAAEVRADVDSPSYLAGVRVRTGGGLLDPMALGLGLRDWAARLGVRIHEGTAVTTVEPGLVRTARCDIRARTVIIATNAYRAPARRLRKYIVPVYDHVLATEPLSQQQWAAIGWSERQGMTDAGNQFHYYRPTADGRILWGGYDAIYHFGSAVDRAREQRDASHLLLAEQFAQTFPQLEGIRFTHRWAGLIDTTSRFTPHIGTDRTGTIAHAIGFTGLGVGFSRLAAIIAVDALDGIAAPGFVGQRPVPFPPEPLRYLAIQLTRSALAREDRTGRRGPLLRTLDRFGVGFNS